MPDFHLSGREVSLVKALGFGGVPIDGATLMRAMGDMNDADFMGLLRGLIVQGIVEGDNENFRTIDEAKAAHYCINAEHARDVRDALTQRARPPTRRQRRRGV